MLIIGNVISAGLGLNMAKNVNILSDLSDSVIPMTLNRACASGMDSIIYAYNLIKNGEKNVIIAGGTESMSNAPFINNKIRSGNRFGDVVIEDSHPLKFHVNIKCGVTLGGSFQREFCFCVNIFQTGAFPFGFAKVSRLTRRFPEVY